MSRKETITVNRAIKLQPRVRTTCTARPLSSRRSSSRRVAGFTLLEVLIALFVLAIGLVSLAALQFTTKRTNFEAVQRSTAAALAQDMIERMRANPEYLFQYTGAGAGITLPEASRAYPPPAALDCGSGTLACSPAQLADYDLTLLQGQITGAAEKIGTVNVGGLSQPTACIRYVGTDAAVGPAAPPTFPSFTSVAGEYEVAIAWRGMTRLSAPTNTCGTGAAHNAKYDDASETAGNHAYRRVLSVRTFIDVSPPAGELAVPGT